MKITIRFTGGPLDGKTVEGWGGEQDEAERYYILSHRGRIGQRFKVASEYAVNILAGEHLQDEQPHHFQQHHYEVIDRFEVADHVRIRVKYV
jgi:hypothetical protein